MPEHIVQVFISVLSLSKGYRFAKVKGGKDLKNLCGTLEFLSRHRISCGRIG